MRDKVYVYPYSHNSAKQNDELQQYQASYEQNLKCTDAIEKAIEKTFDGKQGYSLSPESAKEVIAEFGYDRVNLVLSNTLQQLKHDGRFSRENKEWAKGTYIPVDKVGGVDRRKDFVVNKSHPAVLDGFVNLARKEYQSLELWENKHCNSTDGLDFEGKIMVLHPSNLKDEYKNPHYQLVYTKGGFGCSPTATGRKVGGTFIFDGEDCQHIRNDFIGELKEEHHSEWLIERLGQIGVEYVSLETKENQLLELISDTFSEQDEQDYNALLEERVEVSTEYKINLALAVKNESYTIYRDVDDDLDVGKKYVDEQHSGLDDIIKENLDYEGIVVNLSADGGQMTEVGFILECDNPPEFIYKSSEIDTMLKEYEPKLEQTQGQIPTM